MSTVAPSIDVVWPRLKAFEGEQFETKTGLAFTYSISGDVLVPSRTDYNISKGDVAKALALVPLDGPGQINETVRGPAYVWALLHDKRVRLGEW
jgi:hypothetical protein